MGDGGRPQSSWFRRKILCISWPYGLPALHPLTPGATLQTVCWDLYKHLGSRLPKHLSKSAQKDPSTQWAYIMCASRAESTATICISWVMSHVPYWRPYALTNGSPTYRCLPAPFADTTDTNWVANLQGITCTHTDRGKALPCAPLTLILKSCLPE